MNLILLLSALLSALSGTGGARAAQAPTALSRSSDIVVTAVNAAAVRHQVASRPAQPVAAPVHAMVAALPDFALSDAIPAFASRRRE